MEVGVSVCNIFRVHLRVSQSSVCVCVCERERERERAIYNINKSLALPTLQRTSVQAISVGVGRMYKFCLPVFVCVRVITHT